MPKLNGTENWKKWHHSMKLQLLSRRLWEHVEGVELPAKKDTETQTVYNERLATFRARDATAKALLASNTSHSIRQTLGALEPATAKEVYDHLKQHYEERGFDLFERVWTEFTTLTFNSKDDLEIFCYKHKHVMEELATIGFRIPEGVVGYQFVQFMSGRYPIWASIKRQQFGNCGDECPSIDELISGMARILRKEEKMKPSGREAALPTA
ncbi:hypothetical protein LTR66_005275 [Elasticomyces elasticus]|nr:hypothetical protein LTR66_005275 [Elasticomyces elasticus]